MLEGLAPTVKTETKEVAPVETSHTTTALVGTPQTAGVTKTPAISPARALLEGTAPTTRELLESATATSHAQPTPPTTSTSYGTNEALETGFQPTVKPGQARLEGIASTVKELVKETVSEGIKETTHTTTEAQGIFTTTAEKPHTEVSTLSTITRRESLEGAAPTVESLKETVTGETAPQPIQQTQTGAQGTHVTGAEKPTVRIAKPGEPLLEGVAPTVKSLVTEEVKAAPQPSPAATPPSSKEITAPPSRPGRALLEGVAPTVKELREVASTGVQKQPAQGQGQEEFGGFEGVYRGGRLYR
ncbi:MAG: hypothetical protein L7H05_02050, partial [Vulcanisaeta sp.]|nr:hypothetical protein [Vulcanisaeta sp.]